MLETRQPVCQSEARPFGVRRNPQACVKRHTIPLKESGRKEPSFFGAVAGAAVPLDERRRAGSGTGLASHKNDVPLGARESERGSR